MSASVSYSNINVINTVDRIIRKKGEYGDGLKLLKASNAIIAEALAHDGTVEQSIRDALNDGDGDGDGDGDNDNPQDSDELRDFEVFLKAQRERVKGLAQMHIHTSQHTEAFMTALQEIKTEISNNTIHKHNNANDDNDNDDEEAANISPPDYEVILQTKIELQTTRLARNINSNAHPEMIKIQEKLREPTHNHDQDIELEISNTESSETFKCPITQKVMQNPQRNKSCGHHYSLEGIQSHLRSKKACPIYGCRNKHVTMDQLEDDVEMMMKIKRFEKRSETEKRMRLTQTQDLDGNYENDGNDRNSMGDAGGFTVVE